jgi:hypothetical protein
LQSEDENGGTGLRDRDKMPLNDLVGSWFKGLEDPGNDGYDPGNSGPQNGEEESDEIQLPALDTYRELFSKAPAYDWLLAQIRRELLLSPQMPNHLDAIQQEIIKVLPLSNRMSRKHSLAPIPFYSKSIGIHKLLSRNKVTAKVRMKFWRQPLLYRGLHKMHKLFHALNICYRHGHGQESMSCSW